jgi:Rhodopirellula transposase DDE domain
MSGVLVDESGIRERWLVVREDLDERGRRRWAAAEARSHGWGGIAAVVRATGISESTVRRGIAEVESGQRAPAGRVRRPGAGRKPIVEVDPTLPADLDGLIEPATRGDPESPLRWTSKSIAKLTGALRDMGHSVRESTVRLQVRALGYRLQANRKTREGRQHPDRDRQFEHINETVKAALAAGEPVISVDTKKKELVGNFKNGGREYEPSRQPVEVSTHDFPDKQLGKAIPYGVLDVGANEGFVSVGISADTAQFSVASIRAWWEQLGKQRYPDANVLTITADCGGSNGNRTKLWKVELQKLADEIGRPIQVLHFPPGTSKWNKVEHRLWSFIGQNWRGRPLISHEVIIELIANTTTSTGLKVYARLDQTAYHKGIKVTDAQLAAVNLTPRSWHPEWNYAITPNPNIPSVINE